MKIVKYLKFSQNLRKLNKNELKVGMNVIKNNLKLKPKESVLIVTDPDKEKLKLRFFEALKIHQKVGLISFPV